MQLDLGGAAVLEAYRANYARGRKLVAEASLCRGLSDIHVGDLWSELVAAAPHLPAEIAPLTPEAQRIRVDAELAALKRRDPDAFEGDFTPAYLVTLWRLLGPIVDWQIFGADAMFGDDRRRAIRLARRELRQRGLEVPPFDPTDYPLASPTARRAVQIEAERAEAAKNYSARRYEPAGASGAIAGPARGALLAMPKDRP
jgi:hypothetical protein